MLRKAYLRIMRRLLGAPVRSKYKNLPQKMPYGENELVINLILPDNIACMVVDMADKHVNAFIRNVEKTYNRIYPITGSDNGKNQRLAYRMHMDTNWDILTYQLVDIGNINAVKCLLQAISYNLNKDSYNKNKLLLEQLFIRSEIPHNPEWGFDKEPFHPLTVHFMHQDELVDSFTFTANGTSFYKMMGFQTLALLGLDERYWSRQSHNNIIIDACYQAMLLDYAIENRIAVNQASDEKVEAIYRSPEVNFGLDEYPLHHRLLSSGHVISFANPTYELGEQTHYLPHDKKDVKSARAK